MKNKIQQQKYYNKKTFSPSIMKPTKNKMDSKWDSKWYSKRYLKYIKYIKHVFKSKKIKNQSIIKNKLSRFIFFYKLYKKKKCKNNYYNNFKRKINISKLLWKSLTLNDFNDFMRYNNNSIDIDKKFDKFTFYTLNYYNIENYKDKNKKIFYNIFNNKIFYFLTVFNNRLIDNTNRLIYNVKSKNYLLKYFMHLRNCNLIYYHKFFKINKIYNYNYIFYFYNIIKNSILLKIKYILKLKNYLTYLTLLQEFKSFINIYNDNNEINYFNNFNTNNIINNNIYALKQFINKSFLWTRFFIKRKKWNINAFYFWALGYLKKMVTIYIKINIQFDPTNSIKKKNTKRIIYNNNRNIIFEPNKLRVPKYWNLFLNFIQKSVLFNKSIANKYKINSKYILKKYFFFLSFIKFYLFKIFNCLKYIYFVDNNNKIQYFISKLKFIIFLMFYKNFANKLQIKKWKKNRFKKFVRKTYLNLMHNLKIRFYNNAIIPLKRKVKQMWVIKKMDPYLQSFKLLNIRTERNKKIEKFRQPYNLFKYNPLLNPKHKFIANKKKDKLKRTYKYLFNNIKRRAYKKRAYKKKKAWLKLQKFNKRNKVDSKVILKTL